MLLLCTPLEAWCGTFILCPTFVVGQCWLLQVDATFLALMVMATIDHDKDHHYSFSFDAVCFIQSEEGLSTLANTPPRTLHVSPSNNRVKKGANKTNYSLCSLHDKKLCLKISMLKSSVKQTSSKRT